MGKQAVSRMRGVSTEQVSGYQTLYYHRCTVLVKKRIKGFGSD